MRIILSLIVVCVLSSPLYSQRAIGSNTQAVIGVTAQQVSDSLTTVRSTIDDSLASVRADIPASIDPGYYVSGDTIPEFVFGVLSSVYPGYTYNQLKTIRQANWEAFQAAVAWQIAGTGRRVLIPNVVEMHVNDGETITIGAGKTAVIVGLGKDVSKLYFYPIVKTYDVNIFTCTAAGSSVSIAGLYMWSNPQRHETYNATARPGGVTNRITITDSAVSSGLASSIVGKTINVATTSTTTPTPSYTVSAYNSGTKQITVSGTIALSDNDAVYVAIPFSEDTKLDTINTYGEFWLQNNTTWYIVYAIQSENTTTCKYVFNDFKTEGFDLTILRSSGNATFEANNSEFTGHHGSVFWYSNNETDNKIVLNNVRLINNCHVVYAYIDAAFTTNNLYGSAIYSHPNTQWLWSNVDVVGTNAAAVRQYSSSGSKPTPAYAHSQLVNCRFYDNDEYAIQTSQDMPVYFTNCYFEGTYFFNAKVTITSCRFNDAIIATYEDETDITMTNCEWTNTYCNIDGTYPNTSLSLIGCKIQTVQSNTITISVQKKLYIDNCQFTNNADSPVSTCSVFGQTYAQDLRIINTSFEDTDTPVFFRYGPNTSASGISKTNYVQALFSRCKFATSLISSSQFVNYNNTLFENCIFGSTSGSKGRWIIKPNEDTYNTVLSGTTVAASENYNKYYTSGTIDKITMGTVGLSGPYTFTSKGGSTTFTAYNNPSKTTSNVSFSATIADGESITMQWNPLNKKYTSSTTVTSLDVGNTSVGTLVYGNYGNLTGGTLVIPGTVSIAAGGVTFTDDGLGNLSGTGGSGWISYDTNYFTLYFDSAPTAGDILASYQYYSGTAHQSGMWEKVD